MEFPHLFIVPSDSDSKRMMKNYLLVLLLCTFWSCQTNTEVEDADQEDPVVEIPPYDGPEYAFPGAEGFGQFTSGGRGGKVFYVTSLEDDGQVGTLRYAINQAGKRTIVFATGGTIQLKSRLNIIHGDLTIAGQSAPGDGITIRDFPVVISASNVIVRYLRFRLGDEAAQQADALEARFQKNIIIDHCSISWSTDECATFYGNEDFTLQWSIVSESLKTSVHEKGSHGYGGIWGGKNASFHHNLLAHHDSRNPRLGEAAGKAFALTDKVDMRNNVIYNWASNSTYGGEAMNVNLVNNYYKPGPASPGGSKRNRIISIDKNKVEGTEVFDIWGKFYIEGNVVEGNPNVLADNWQHGVINQFHGSYGTVSSDELAAMRLDVPHEIYENVNTHSAEEALEWVLDQAGNNLSRDSVDERIIANVRSNTFDFEGSLGSTNGIIDSQSDVGGWPSLRAGQAILDSDLDGMSDEWEKANGLDHESASDGKQVKPGTPYTYLEVYLNSLIKDFPLK